VDQSAATAAVCTAAGFAVGCTLVQGVVAAFPTHLQSISSDAFIDILADYTHVKFPVYRISEG